jgi:hypothetical protein
VGVELDGVPDPTFGGGDGLAGFTHGDGEVGFAVAFAQDRSDGGYLLAGSFAPGAGHYHRIRRFAADGSVDATFGGGNVTAVTPGTVAHMTVDTLGRPILAGSTSTDFLVARLTRGGALDLTFSEDGYTEIDFPQGNTDRAKGVASAPRRIMVGGTASNGDDDQPASVVLGVDLIFADGLESQGTRQWSAQGP